MRLLTFAGGIHPDDGKRFSKDREIQPVIPQGDAQDDLPQKRPSQSPSSSAKREHRLSSGEARVGALHLPHL